MVFIDASAVNVALPVLQRELHADIAQVQWIVEAYALFLAALVLVGGSLGDHFGRRRIFLIGVAAFAACSVLCGAAPGARLMIVARSVQGVAGALLVPSSLAILSASFGDDRGKAIGTWSSLTSLMMPIGPILGGWLVQQLSWRWVFFLNLPLAAIVLFLALRSVPESRDPRAGALDLLGALLATVALGGIVFGLIEASTRGFRAPVVGISMAIGALLLAVFVLHEARTESPLLPLDIFRSRLFSATNLLTLLLYAALGGATFYLPFDLIQIQHYSPAKAGAANLPMVAAVVLLSRYAGALADRFGPKPFLVAGPLVIGAGFLLLAVPSIGGSYWTTFFPAALVLGLGLATTVAPLTTAVMTAAGERSGVGSGVNNAVARTAGLIAVAAFSVVFVSRYAAELESRITAPPEVKASITRQAARLADIEVRDARLRRQVDESFVGAFRTTMCVAAALAGASALIALFGIGHREAMGRPTNPAA